MGGRAGGWAGGWVGGCMGPEEPARGQTWRQPVGPARLPAARAASAHPAVCSSSWGQQPAGSPRPDKKAASLRPLVCLSACLLPACLPRLPRLQVIFCKMSSLQHSLYKGFLASEPVAGGWGGLGGWLNKIELVSGCCRLRPARGGCSAPRPCPTLPRTAPMRTDTFLSLSQPPTRPHTHHPLMCR